jgi:hypothetical protein
MMPTPRLPQDYARCADGGACPFRDCCKRWLTQSYDIGGESFYSFANLYADIGKTSDGEPHCSSRIVWGG